MWEAWKRSDGRGKSGSLLVAGLWTAAPFFLQAIDFVFPAVTRTLVQFFSCRPLGSAGSWLTVDYSVRCRGPDKADQAYKEAAPWVAIFAVVYSLGIPALFGFLVHRYSHSGELASDADKLHHRALGWMWTPFRPGREWWLWVEMLRVLLLTSAIGFLAETCWMKLAVALFIAFFFIIIFQHGNQA